MLENSNPKPRRRLSLFAPDATGARSRRPSLDPQSIIAGPLSAEVVKAAQKKLLDEIGNSNTTTQKSVGPRLFRKQRSTTGEDEVSKTEEPQEPEEVDPIYLMLKQATIMRQGKAAAGTDEGGLQMNISKTQAASAEELARQQQQLAEQISKIAIANNPLLQLKQLEVAPPFVNKSSGTPRLASSTRSLLVNTPSVESQCSDKSDTSSKVSVTNGSVVTNGNKILVPILKHPKLTGKMKSLSLDSSDHSGIIQNLQPLPFPSCFPRSTLSPACIEQRRHTSLQWSKNSSVETADEMERSSCSTSCTSNGPSPYGSSLNNSLPPLPIVISSGAWYALLANYPARHPEEPDLRAGEKFLIGDHPHDSEWLQGVTEDGVVCTIPAAYLARLSPGERPVRVLENLQLFEGRKSLKLLRNQIVITFQEDADGGLWIRTMDGYRAKCPAEYLQYTD